MKVRVNLKDGTSGTYDVPVSGRDPAVILEKDKFIKLFYYEDGKRISVRFAVDHIASFEEEVE